LIILKERGQKMVDLLKLKSLEELIYKNARIVTNYNKIFEGKISSYTRADDSDDGLEEIGIEMPTHVECFDRTMIKSIEIIEEAAIDNPEDIIQVIRLYNRQTPIEKIASEVNKPIFTIKAFLNQCEFKEAVN